MPSEETLNKARKYHIKLTRKLPNSPKRVYKTEKELANEIEKRKRKWSKGGPKCFRPTQAITELKRHNGQPCPKGQERTEHFCVKEIKPYDKKNVKWYRTLSPNNQTRITIICPK